MIPALIEVLDMLLFYNKISNKPTFHTELN